MRPKKCKKASFLQRKVLAYHRKVNVTDYHRMSIRFIDLEQIS